MSITSRPRRGQNIAFTQQEKMPVFATDLFNHFMEEIESSITVLEANVGNTVIINKLSDFPAPVASVITLELNKIYLITGNIDIEDNTIFFQFNSVIEGFGTLLSSITTSSLLPLLSGEVEARSLTLFADYPVQVVSEILILRRVSTAGVGTLGITGQDCPRIFIDELRSVDGATMISLSGAHGFIQIYDCEIDDTTVAGLDLGTSTLDVMFLNGTIFNSANGTGITGLAASGNLVLGAVVSGCAFVGGLTPLTNITTEDLLWDFQDNIGLQDSNIVGAMEQVANASTTTLITNTAVQLAGTFVLSPPNERFILTSFELDALVDGKGLASVSMDGGGASGGSAERYDIVLLQNGTPDNVFRAISVDTAAGSIGLEVPVTWVAGDTFSIAVIRRTGVRNWLTENATLFIR